MDTQSAHQWDAGRLWPGEKVVNIPYFICTNYVHVYYVYIHRLGLYTVCIFFNNENFPYILLLSIYWDYALTVPLRQIVCIHCHQRCEYSTAIHINYSHWLSDSIVLWRDCTLIVNGTEQLYLVYYLSSSILIFSKWLRFINNRLISWPVVDEHMLLLMRLYNMVYGPHILPSISDPCIWEFCHFPAECGGTLVLVSQDGIQRPPLHFPPGGHLLAFLSCLETGLLPRGQLEPPLWSQKGKVGCLKQLSCIPIHKLHKYV